jgi:hypothetical protein
MIKELLDAIQQRLSEFFNPIVDWIFNPLWSWWAIFILIFAACVVIAYFLPFKWIRAALGFIVLLAGAWLAGGTMMYRDMKGRLEAERAKNKARTPRPAQKPREPWWPFGN